MRIGVPRGLLHSRYGAAWRSIITTLGHECVVSPDTNRSILDSGCRLAVDETCLSVKAYLGHVAWLAERTDAVLVPRFVSVRRRERECVKLWGIHDIARNSLPDAHIIGYSVDASGMTQQVRGPIGGLYEFATTIGAPPARAALATVAALGSQLAERASARLRARRGDTQRPRILVVGHGYNLHDAMIGAPIIGALRELGCTVIESSDIAPGPARRTAAKVSPGLQWTNNRHLLGAIHCKAKNVDGIVVIVTFPCGPDSMMAEVITRTVHSAPVLTLVIDEHSGEGGLRTRLESFVDIVSMQRGQESASRTIA